MPTAQGLAMIRQHHQQAQPHRRTTNPQLEHRRQARHITTGDIGTGLTTQAQMVYDANGERILRKQQDTVTL